MCHISPENNRSKLCCSKLVPSRTGEGENDTARLNKKKKRKQIIAAISSSLGRSSSCDFTHPFSQTDEPARLRDGHDVSIIFREAHLSLVHTCAIRGAVYASVTGRRWEDRQSEADVFSASAPACTFFFFEIFISISLRELKVMLLL